MSVLDAVDSAVRELRCTVAALHRELTENSLVDRVHHRPGAFAPHRATL